MKCKIIVCSDRCSSGQSTDKSGPALEEMVKNQLEISNTEIKIVPDEIEVIKDELISATENNFSLILTSGGTGFAPRDVTPEATRAVIEKEAPGLVVAMLMESLKITPHAALSRPVAGTRQKSLIINLPGSTKGATESLGAVVQSIPHALDLLTNDLESVEKTHDTMLIPNSPKTPQKVPHVCPHKMRKTTIKDAPAARDRKSPWPMVPVPDALRMLIELCSPVDLELIEMSQALNRIVGEEVIATVALPPFPASIKDGYAVHSADGAGTRRVRAAVVAGSSNSALSVPRGQCARVNTGAPVPLGCDAVVQVEDTKVIRRDQNQEEVEVSVPAVTSGNDIRPVGSDIQMNEKLLQPGEKLTPARIGLCCTVGRDKVQVYRKIRVIVFSTGAELVEIGHENPGFGQVFDSNRHALKASLEKVGVCEVTDGGILPDNPQDLLDAFGGSLDKYDIIITSGGVSMGEKDYIKNIITNDLNGTIHFGRVNMKPGKPTTFATFENSRTLFFGLPGNPTSSLVTFTLFVKPVLKLLTGQKPTSTIIQAKIAEDIYLDPRPEYHRCVLDFTTAKGVPVATSTGSQCSANINSCSKANGLIIVPQKDEKRDKIEKGDLLNVMLFEDL